MRRLGVAIRSYVGEHDQNLPNTLLELKPYLPNKDDLRWALGDVEYLPQVKVTDPNGFVRTLIAYDAAPLAEDSETYALSADFSVRRIAEQELQQLGVDYRRHQRTVPADRWIVLHTAIKTYAKEHEGRLPDTLDELKPYVVGEQYSGWIARDVEYLSPGRFLGAMQSWAPIACEKRPFVSDQFTTVLFADGATPSMYPKEINQLARLDRRSKKSAEILMRIGRAMLIYANDHEGKYPDTLDGLKEHLRADELAWAKGRIEYLGAGKTTADGPEVATAYDAELQTEGKGTNLLFNDCHVEFADPDTLKRWNISSTPVLLKVNILTATDDFLEDIGLDANSVRTSELWSEHLISDGPGDPNSQPYRLILDDLTVDLLLKAVRAAPEDKGVRVVTAPQVVALDGKLATMKVVRAEYVLFSSSDPNAPSAGRKPKPKTIDVGTSIRITPDVLPGDENVSVDFEWELRQIRGFKEYTGPDKKKKRLPLIAVDAIESTAVIPDSRTLLICGTRFTEYRQSAWSVPLLSDLPGVGGAFRGKTSVKGEPRTLLIMVKAVIDPQELPTSPPPPLDPNDPLPGKLQEKFEHSDRPNRPGPAKQLPFELKETIM
jgi:hypothetical protein